MEIKEAIKILNEKREDIKQKGIEKAKEGGRFGTDSHYMWMCGLDYGIEIFIEELGFLDKE